jgi:G8 domain
MILVSFMCSLLVLGCGGADVTGGKFTGVQNSPQTNVQNGDQVKPQAQSDTSITAAVPTSPPSSTLVSSQPAVTTSSAALPTSTQTALVNSSVASSAQTTTTPVSEISLAQPRAMPKLTSLRWSDPNTWGGVKPTAGANIIVPFGKTIILDETPPALGGLTINGELSFEDGKTIELKTNYILVSGALKIGSAQARYSGRATLTFNGNETSVNVSSMGNRGLFSMGGRIEMYGQVPVPVQSVINEHAPSGTRQLTLATNTNWKAGDQIIMSPTDFYGVSETERLEVSQAQQNSITTVQALTTPRWGKLQYVNASGMGLNPSPQVLPTASGTPTVLDERAAVANLSRNIVIQSEADSLWQTSGYGAQVMVMGSNSVTNIDSVELRRVGQSGKAGRYPIHFHLLSYDTSSGNEIAFGGVRNISNNAIWDSQNRCITIHGTNDTVINNNICYDIAGHAVFLEDAVERRNKITNNLVLKVRVPKTSFLNSDKGAHTRGPSGFWITNPDNVITGNRAADAAGNGFWLAFPKAPLGANKLVKNGLIPMSPTAMKFGVFDQNISHSNRKIGIQFDWAPFNDAGDTEPITYTPTSDESTDRYNQNRVRSKLTRTVTFKNREAAFWNRVHWVDYEQWISADNEGLSFSGAGSNGTIKRSLVIGESLNNATNWKMLTSGVPPAAFASYHSSFDIADNTAVNFRLVPGLDTGVFRTDDYYITAVDKGLARNGNNLLINSHPGYRTPVKTQENWTLAGALWDPHGYWGPKGNYWTYDNPFLTAGSNCAPVDTGGGAPGTNGLSCDSNFYGVTGYWSEKSAQYLPFMPIKATRYDSNGQFVGSWAVGDGTTAPKLGNMRHFAAKKGGRYLLEFPSNKADPNAYIPAEFFQFNVTNAYRTDDEFVIGVPFMGTVSPRVTAISTTLTKKLVTAGSIAEVISSSGEKFWQDKANNTVWIKAKKPDPETSLTSTSGILDSDLYRAFWVRIER